MSNVQIINASAPLRVSNAQSSNNKLMIPSTTMATETSNSILIHDATATGKHPDAGTGHMSAEEQSMYRSPLKKRPYREPDLLAEDHHAKRLQISPDNSNVVLEQQQVVLVEGGVQHAAELQAVNMADVASTVHDAYIETVQFTFNNTMTMRQSLTEKLVCPPTAATLDEVSAANCWKAYEARFNEAITDVVNFAKRIPGFTALETDDQIILIKGGSFEVFTF